MPFFFRFKVKVGANLEDDIRRVGLVRQHIGPDYMLVSTTRDIYSSEMAYCII
jgi:L-alanine-DL-glutamate epimerase-like enolase superfamily enzyme